MRQKLDPEAKRVRDRFDRKLRRLQDKVRDGDSDASLLMIGVMTEQNIAMAALGYYWLKDDVGWERRDSPPKISPTAQSRLADAVRRGDYAALGRILRESEDA